MSRRKSSSKVKHGAETARPAPTVGAKVPQEDTTHSERTDSPFGDVAASGSVFRMPSITSGLAYFMLNQSDGGLQLEDKMRWGLAIRSGPDLILERSVLKDWVQAAELPEATLRVLAAVLFIRYVGLSSAVLGQMRVDLKNFAMLFCGYLPGVEPRNGEDPRPSAYRTVDQDLARIEGVVRRFEGTLEECGYRWNKEETRIETASGGRPRQLLRDLVRGAVLHELASANTLSLRTKIARILAPFFDQHHLKTDKGSPLYNAVDNALASP